MRSVILRYVMCAVMVLPLASGSRVKAESNSFDWQGNTVGTPYVAAPSAGTIMPGAARAGYSPTIYAVGSTELPSDAYDPTTEGRERANKPGVRSGHGDDGIGGPEYGQSSESPIGDAVWPLMILVGAYCSIMFVRRKRMLKS